MPSRSSLPQDEKPNLFGLDRQGLAEFLARYDAPAFHARQIYRWLYGRRVFEPAGWTDLALGLRGKLETDARVEAGRFVDRQQADDGTLKYRYELPDGAFVEAVRMEQDERVTLCLSSQVGCALDCSFCLTARMGLKRQLTPGEIVGQAATILGSDGPADGPFNVVFMGMGEPLHNYDSVLAAYRLLTDAEGFGLSRKRVTISTSGLAPAIEKLAAEPRPPRLAISLNATTDELRDRIMPVNRRYPIERLLSACDRFGRETGERFSFEYVLLSGINDTDDDVNRLVSIVRRRPAKLNLIPFNPVPGWLPYQPPAHGRILEIRDRLLAAGVPVSIRFSRGAGARAACGQLALLPDSTMEGEPR